MNNPEKDGQRKALDEVMQQILSEDNPYAYSMIATVRRYIQHFGLSSQVEPADILVEAYLRGLKITEQGTLILSCRAWIKGTARYIALERFRHQRRERPTNPQASVLETPSESKEDCQDSCDRNFAILWQAFEQLRRTSPDIAELMDWRVLQGLSWSQIRQRLVARDGKSHSEEALRQRASRAKRKLRRLFHELGGEYEPLQF